MNKKIMIIVLLIVALIAGGSIYLLTSKDDTKVNQDTMVVESTTQPLPATSAAPPDTTSPAGTYTEYEDNAIASTQGTKLLFFHAPWCPQCRDLEADIVSKGVPGGVTIYKVDYDSNRSLRQKYGVTLQTTVVKVDDNGELIKKYVAYDDPSLASIKDNLLQ